MSQTAKPGADRYRILLVYVYYLVQGIGIAIVYASLLGWVGIAVGAAFLLGLVWLFAFTGRRFPRLPVTEVGNTRIEAKAGSGGRFSRKAGMAFVIVGAAVFTLGVVFEAIKLLQDYVTSGSAEGLDWMPMIRQLTISIVCLSSLFKRLDIEGGGCSLRNKAYFKSLTPPVFGRPIGTWMSRIPLCVPSGSTTGTRSSGSIGPIKPASRRSICTCVGLESVFRSSHRSTLLRFPTTIAGGSMIC